MHAQRLGGLEVMLVQHDEPVGAGNGSGVSSTALTNVKIVVLAPMPMASDRIATALNPGSSGARAARRSGPDAGCRGARVRARRGTPPCVARPRPSPAAPGNAPRRATGPRRRDPRSGARGDSAAPRRAPPPPGRYGTAIGGAGAACGSSASPGPQTGLTTSEIAAERRSHWAVSVFNAFRPAAVRV